MGDKPHHETGAADRAHGTHGKGDAREERLDDAVVEPGNSADVEAQRKFVEGRMGDPQWGSEGSGGSTVDKRPEKGRKE
jgi:hypothetical protein